MNTKQLIASGYKIENAKITSADISMEGHGYLTFSMGLDGENWRWVYGDYGLGRRYLGTKKFEGSSKGIEYIMQIMDTVGVARMSDLKGKYIRVAIKSQVETLKIIGNVIDDKWFDPEDFFKTEKEQQS